MESNRAAHSPGLRTPSARRALLMASRQIDLVLDVGAYRGDWALGLRRAGFGGDILSFEPLADNSFAALQQRAATDPRWAVQQVALGSRVSPADLHVARDPSCNSLLDVTARSVASAPESAFVGTETISVVTRLDHIWRDLVPPTSRVYLKVDVQGFELEVLDGGGPHIAAVVLLEVELSLAPVYDGGPLWREVVEYLSERAFRLVAVESVFEEPSTGETLQINGIFAR